MISSLINEDRAELTQAVKKASPVVLCTRIRLARNLVDQPFPGRAKVSQRRAVLKSCVGKIGSMSKMKKGTFLDVANLSDLEKQVLVERHLISRELCEGEEGTGVYINKAQTCAVMINEEDHLRIQFLKTGFNLKPVWKLTDAFDSELEETLDIAFSPEFGYLTACPTNLGTGLRASVMMHLPGLVISNEMERVIRAVNQLGITVRGLFGEASDPTGHIFQISNQQTLGESEPKILDRLSSVLKTIIDHELNARYKYLEENRQRVCDRIGRAFGVLKNAYIISSDEALNFLSVIRVAVDFDMLPEEARSTVDRLMIECQPGHIQYAVKESIDPEIRDISRADKLREEFDKLPILDFHKIS
ncbi:MAG: protein arginine kinase [Lentimonas sp.]|jgi:protein arginine kinase